MQSENLCGPIDYHYDDVVSLRRYERKAQSTSMKTVCFKEDTYWEKKVKKYILEIIKLWENLLLGYNYGFLLLVQENNLYWITVLTENSQGMLYIICVSI